MASAPSRLSYAQAVADTRRLLELLELSHPDPYSPLGGKVAFKRKAALLLSSLPAEGIAPSQLQTLLDEFLALLADGHTHMLREGLSWYAPPDALPLAFDVTIDGLHVLATDLPEMKGTRGYRLLGVNGLSIDELRKRWAHLAPVENEYHAYAMLRRVLTSPTLLARVVPEAAKRISLELLSPTGRRETRALPLEPRRSGAAAPEQWLEAPIRVTRVPSKADPFFFHFLRDGAIAYLRVATIMGREAYELAMRYGWGNPREMIRGYYTEKGQAAPTDLQAALAGIPSFLETTRALLEEMKQRRASTLVVDLQSNGGGVTPMVLPFLQQMYGDAYYAHNFPGEFVTVFSQLYLDKYHKDLAALRKATGAPELMLGDYAFDEEDKSSGESKRKKAIERYKAKGLSFAASLEALGGQPIYTPPTVVVLCDEGTFSAAFHFLFFLRDLGATVVGVPPGQSPNTFMEMTEFVLPNSRLKGSISNSAQIFVPTDPAARVLMPNVLLTYGHAKKYRFAADAPLQLALDRLAARSQQAMSHPGAHPVARPGVHTRARPLSQPRSRSKRRPLFDAL